MSYCDTLTDRQVRNVLRREAARADRSLYVEAREELLRRGFEPDEVAGPPEPKDPERTYVPHRWERAHYRGRS